MSECNSLKEAATILEQASAKTEIEWKKNCKLETEKTFDRLEIPKKLAELKRYTNDTKLKKFLAYFIIGFTCVWSVAILALIYCVAFQGWGCSLSNKVIIALITQTLFLVLGLPIIVTRHLFPKYKRLPRNLSAGNIRLRRFS